MMHNKINSIDIQKFLKLNITLRKILIRYKLKENDKITLNLLDKIHKETHISTNDLKYILQITDNTMYNLKNNKQLQFKLKFNKKNGIPDKNLLNKSTINYAEFNNLKMMLNVKNYTLIRMLGISKYKYKKMKNDFTYTVTIKDVTAEYIVNLIKLDLKYQNKNNTYLSRRKLRKLCNKYGISEYEFAKYYGKNPKHEKFNLMILQKSIKGFWIGTNTRMPNDFLNKNYEYLTMRLKKVVHRLDYITGLKNFKEDLIQEAIGELYTKCGNIIKNFYFDTRVLFNILISKAKYFIMNIYRKKYQIKRTVSYDSFSEDGNLDHMDFLSDDRFDPQNLLVF